MNEIKDMIESAPTRKSARKMLTLYRIFGNVTEKQYKEGLKLIRKEFGK